MSEKEQETQFDQLLLAFQRESQPEQTGKWKKRRVSKFCIYVYIYQIASVYRSCGLICRPYQNPSVANERIQERHKMIPISSTTGSSQLRKVENERVISF